LTHLSRKLGWSPHRVGQLHSKTPNEDDEGEDDDDDLTTTVSGQPFDDGGPLTAEIRAFADPSEPLVALTCGEALGHGDATVSDVNDHFGTLPDGSTVTMARMCGSPCGNEYKPDSLFCRKCGRRRPVASPSVTSHRSPTSNLVHQSSVAGAALKPLTADIGC
jgi:hypothetical protein